MKRIMLLSTGGTIASAPSAEGLRPQVSPQKLLEYVPGIRELCEVDFREVLSMDSSNIQPEEWQAIAKAVYESLQDYDGVVITHGTDTMAYTASVLSYMLRGLQKPVILTGSQVPVSNLITDAVTNLTSAFMAACSGVPGVYVVFHYQIIQGTRAVKVRTTGFDAFASVNAPLAGTIDFRGVHITNPQPVTGTMALLDKLNPDVFLLKMIPATKPEMFNAILRLGYRGIVIEAFGIGGLHFVRRNLVDKLQMLAEHGVNIVITSQCLYEMSDLSVYETGRVALESGVISANDMTTEAAVTKLMWAMGQERTPQRVRELFCTPLCGEITV